MMTMTIKSQSNVCQAATFDHHHDEDDENGPDDDDTESDDSDRNR